MAGLEYQRLVIAYHGCDESVANKALKGGRLNSSDNDYDWLGSGIYFWEHGPARALEWAKMGKAKKPAVIGALIQLGHCFDLLDVRATNALSSLFPKFEEAILGQNAALPTNDAARKLHRLDCAFLNWSIPLIEKSENTFFHTVRGVFLEGDRPYENAQFYRQSHIQIAVRDPSAIIGYFRPSTLN